MKRKSLLILCLTVFAFCGGYAQEQKWNEYELKVLSVLNDHNTWPDEQELDEVLRQYYDSGLYPQEDLQYHYNEFQGMDNWGICIINNMCSLIGMLMLQRVFNVHRDKILSLNWITRHTKRPVYLPCDELNLFYPEDMPDSIKACLYNEGLMMHYSARPYDNQKVKFRNLEERYLFDYLQMSFRPYDPRKDKRRLNYPTPLDTGGYYSVLFFI